MVGGKALSDDNRSLAECGIERQCRVIVHIRPQVKEGRAKQRGFTKRATDAGKWCAVCCVESQRCVMVLGARDIRLFGKRAVQGPSGRDLLLRPTRLSGCAHQPEKRLASHRLLQASQHGNEAGARYLSCAVHRRKQKCRVQLASGSPLYSLNLLR